VLVPGNFQEGAMVSSNVEAFVKEGFRIGEHVVLNRRITVKYGTKDNERKDISDGTKVAVKAFVGTEYIVCEFEVPNSKGKMITVDWKVNKSNLKLARIANEEKNEALSSQTSASKRYPFLANDCSDNLDLVESWQHKLWSNDDDMDSHRVKNIIAFTLDALVQKCPTYTDKDFLLVRRQSQLEIWTLRDFKPKSIVFCPESAEMKPKHWTANRSAIVKKKDGTVDVGKTMVIDGRVRASPDGKTGFALYWIVTRANAKDKDAIQSVNMESTYIEAECKVTVKLKNDTTFNINDTEMPCFPVLVNPKKIAKHTRLVACEDADLSKMNALVDKEKMNEAKEHAAKIEKRKSDNNDEKSAKKGKK
jgi:hypothetical protein